VNSVQGLTPGAASPHPYTSIAAPRMAVVEMDARGFLLRFVKWQANVIFGERGRWCSRACDVIEFG
jgi:hypothetical protein